MNDKLALVAKCMTTVVSLTIYAQQFCQDRPTYKRPNAKNSPCRDEAQNMVLAKLA